jgi:hypothetical protein
MKTFIVTAADASKISTLFPCTNHPSGPEVLNARSSGSRERNKVLELYFDLESPPQPNCTLTITFPPPNVNRPQVWSLRPWLGFADGSVSIQEEDTQFVIFLPNHRAPFIFPKTPMHDATILRILEAFQIPKPELA